MRHQTHFQIRRWLLAACLVALLPLGWRAQQVAAEIQRERAATALYAEGLRHYLAGRYDEAAGFFRQVIAVAPLAADAYSSLADAEFRRGDVDAAVQAYRRLLAIYPYTFVGLPYREVGFMELRAGRWTDARADLEQAVTLDPQDWHAYYLLGHVHRRLGDLEAARRAWRHVLTLRPGYQPAVEQLRQLDER